MRWLAFGTGLFLLAALARAQTLTVPVTGNATTADGRPISVSGSVTVTVGAAPTPVPTPTPTPTPTPVTYGPRGPLGPDVPLDATETAALARRITVSGFTDSAVAQAIVTARGQGITTVYLPAGTYPFQQTVSVPGGLTILGAGAGTVIKAPTSGTKLFEAVGDRVRFTRLTLSGYTTAWTDANAGGDYNGSVGIQAFGRQDLRVDHCELSGFCVAVLGKYAGSMQVDHSLIHQNPVVGLGYGVSTNDGEYTLVTDNQFGDSRHELTSADAVTTYRPGRWEFLYNRVTNPHSNSNQKVACDAHPEFRGTFVVQGNRFEARPDAAVGPTAGSGLIQGNQVLDTYAAFNLFPAANAGVTGSPHDIRIEGNTYTNVTQPLRFGLSGNPNATNIWLDGAVVPATAKAGGTLPVLPPRLIPMDASGHLSIQPGARPTRRKR